MSALIAFFLFVCFIISLIFATGFHPKPVTSVKVINNADKIHALPTKKPFKVLSFNVQFFAGKSYVFWFDMPQADGPDHRVSNEHQQLTLQDVVRIVLDEDPDFILLQELDHNAKRTNYNDQLQMLLGHLSERYPSYCTADYWRSPFVPHPKILGRSGLQLAVLSKYTIQQATRIALPVTPNHFIAKHHGPKRALLEVQIASDHEQGLTLINTHFEAFHRSSDVLQQQVDFTTKHLEALDKTNKNWVLGGDLNLLPPNAYELLPVQQRVYFSAQTELTTLLNQYPSVPSVQQIEEQPEACFTHFPNDPTIDQPDRTLDYIFYSPRLTCLSSSIRQHDTLDISDHFPVIATFQL